MDVAEIAARVPDYQSFLTVDETTASTHRLAAEFPDVATVRVAGQSRAGADIELVSVGEGPQAALVVGAPHPNEPIGCMTIEFLARLHSVGAMSGAGRLPRRSSRAIRTRARSHG